MGWPGYRDFGNRAGNFPISTDQPGYGDEKKNSNTHACLSKENEVSIIPTFFKTFYCKNDFLVLNE